MSVCGTYTYVGSLPTKNNVFFVIIIIIRELAAVLMHRRPEGGGQPGAVAPPLEFENDDVICCSRGKYLKIFARSPTALASNILKFSLKRRKNRKFFVRAFGASKNGSFFQSARFCPPLEKFLRAPMHICTHTYLRS